MNNFIGVDPGLTGSIAILDAAGKFLNVHDMTIAMKRQSGSFVKRQVCGTGLWLQIKSYNNEATIAFVETVGARPGQGVSSMFSLGDSFGVARGVLSASNIRLEEVTPPEWMKALGVTQEKDSSLILARQLFPTAPLPLKKHHNRAEALLIAHYLFKLYTAGAI